MIDNITCLGTLHGIGFERPPQDGEMNSGYADLLHLHLKKCLDGLLSDDPDPIRKRGRKRPGENGTIYVESRWEGQTTHVTSRENGLKRLNGCLVANHEPVSHIALVYSNLEPQRRNVLAGTMAILMSLFSVLRYATPLELARMFLADAGAVGRHLAVRTKGPICSLPRIDRNTPFAEYLRIFRSTRLSLEADVACYICDNEERERVRSFVSDALIHLASRPDVEKIILNTHSNGTVVAFDVFRHLPEEVTNKIKVFVTAGSPLRKYAALFAWGIRSRRATRSNLGTISSIRAIPWQTL